MPLAELHHQSKCDWARLSDKSGSLLRIPSKSPTCYINGQWGQTLALEYSMSYEQLYCARSRKAAVLAKTSGRRSSVDHSEMGSSDDRAEYCILIL